VPDPAADEKSVMGLVWEVLVKQLGHRPTEAAQLITRAFRRRPGIQTPEDSTRFTAGGRGQNKERITTVLTKFDT
jgi:hypothetical protein